VTPDQPVAQGHNITATEVGEAIRWLDMGAGGQAMQAITRALDNTNGGATPVRAWSGYSGSAPSDGSAPPLPSDSFSSNLGR
jgi:hypothetical protein